jgi:hypothetical protein
MSHESDIRPAMKAEIKIPEGYEGPLKPDDIKRAGDMVLHLTFRANWIETENPGEEVGCDTVIRPIPAPKKIRPLDEKEWAGVIGCVMTDPRNWSQMLVPVFRAGSAEQYANKLATCHPPGFPNDIRNLWVEE